MLRSKVTPAIAVMCLAMAGLVPTTASSQGDPAAFTAAYDRCMSYKPANANHCYQHTCAYQGCIAGYSSRVVGGGIPVDDPAKAAYVAACMPHIDALKRCVDTYGVVKTLPPKPPEPPKQPKAASLTCKAKDNEEKSCCCFLGTHTYRFDAQSVGTATVTFDTGRRLDCKSTVSIDVLVGERWKTLKQVQANSSRGGSELAPQTETVSVNGVIGGVRVGDGCVCCIDDSKVQLK